MQKLEVNVINGVVQQIERRGMQVGTVTRDGMVDAIRVELAPGKLSSSLLPFTDSPIVMELLRRGAHSSQPPAPAPPYISLARSSALSQSLALS